jgi:hypothetical protein
MPIVDAEQRRVRHPFRVVGNFHLPLPRLKSPSHSPGSNSDDTWQRSDRLTASHSTTQPFGYAPTNLYPHAD